jgi:hypothetical protein
MARAHYRACMLSLTPGNRRRSSTAADSSPRCSNAARMTSASFSVTANIPGQCARAAQSASQCSVTPVDRSYVRWPYQNTTMSLSAHQERTGPLTSHHAVEAGHRQRLGGGRYFPLRRREPDIYSQMRQSSLPSPASADGPPQLCDSFDLPPEPRHPASGSNDCDSINMPIRRELRPLYPPHWRELSQQVRFERAGGRCLRCGRPHLTLVRCLPDGRWFDEQGATWRDRRGCMARWPDLVEATWFRMTRVVLAAATEPWQPKCR